MTLYLDTSALIKLYIEESHSENVLYAVRNAAVIVTSYLAYPETWASLGRARREHLLTERDFQRALTKFLEDWEHVGVISAHDSIMRTAGTLAERHALRGADAVHLASALHIAPSFASHPHAFRFLAFDTALSRGAARENLAFPSLP